MARWFGASLLCVLILAGCEGAGPSGPARSVEPTPESSATDRPSSGPTEGTSPSPTTAPGCPKGPLTVAGFLDADPRCYVADEIAVVGWWGGRRTDDPARGADLDHMLRGSIPFGASSQPPEDFLFIDDLAAVAPGGWPGGVHWATVTGRRSATNDRACHYDEGPDLTPIRHCPSYLVASRVAESDPPTDALVSCAGMSADAAGWVEVESFTAYPPACFGSRDMTVRGWLDIRYLIMGWEDSWGVAPYWLWVPIGPWTVVAPGSNPETSAALIVYSDPERGIDLGQTNRWVLLTGHYADPKADTCEIVYAGGYDAARDGPRVASEFARRWCEVNFVVTAVRDTTP